MTALAAVAGFAAGTLTTTLLAIAHHRHHTGEHDARRLWLTETRVRTVWADADHHKRLADRLARALTALDQLHRDVVGDLLDAVAQRDRTIARLRPTRPRHLRRSPMPAYGIHRAAS